MNKYLIAHHLGMGDHIVLNGLVRHIYERETENGNEVHLLCYNRNKNNVEQMYRDIKINLSLIEHQDEIGARISKFPGKVEDLHLWGGNRYSYEEYADEAFFMNFGYSVELLNQFKILRSLQAEQVAFNSLMYSHDIKLKEPYIFVHDDPQRDLNINKNLLPSGIKIVRPGNKIPMFDLLGIMEQAQECHFISSSFLCIALAYKGLIKNSVAHLYVKNQFLSKYLNKYNIKTIL